MLLSMKTIAEWLGDELARTGLTQAELSRKSGVSTAQIARAVNGQRGLSETSIKAIAEALKIPPEQAFRDVGFLPPVPNRTEQSEWLLYAFDRLTDEEKKTVTNIMEFYLSKK